MICFVFDPLNLKNFKNFFSTNRINFILEIYGRALSVLFWVCTSRRLTLYNTVSWLLFFIWCSHRFYFCNIWSWNVLFSTWAGDRGSGTEIKEFIHFYSSSIIYAFISHLIPYVWSLQGQQTQLLTDSHAIGQFRENSINFFHIHIFSQASDRRYIIVRAKTRLAIL